MLHELALALAPALAFVPGETPGTSPLTIAEAAQSSPQLQFERYERPDRPHIARLRLTNPSANPLSIETDVRPEWSNDGEPGPASLLRIETWEEGQWIDHTGSESIEAAEVPPGFAKIVEARFPPRIHPFRVGVQVSDPEPRWLWTELIDRPHNLIPCPPSEYTGPFLRQIGFDETPDRREVIVLACNPLKRTSIEFFGDDFGMPIGYQVQVLRSGAWINERLGWCGQCARHHEIPAGTAMPFRAFVSDPDLPLRVGWRFGGLMCWTEPFRFPSPLKPLNKDIAAGPPVVRFANFTRDPNSKAYFTVENRSESALSIRSHDGRPEYRVEVLDGEDLVPRSGNRYEHQVPHLTLPPRTKLLFKVTVWHAERPMRVGIGIPREREETEIVWSEVIEIPPK